MRHKVRFGIAILIVAFVAGWFWWSASAVAYGGWGVDAVLTRHASTFEWFAYIHSLADSGVGLLRERGVGTIEPDAKREELSAGEEGEWRGDVRNKFRDVKKRGFTVVAFATLPFKANSIRSGNQLPEDLLEMFRQGRFLGREFTGLVDAWEMTAEPDLGYCTDLPDRVAAYQKALYLGLKAGSREQGAKSPIVLMGALGMPPGPWLERAAANGLLDYTDAYNFHFYGQAADLTGVIQAHREAIRLLGVRRYGLNGAGAQNEERLASNERHATMPLWITEAGIEAVDKKDFLNPQRRQLQADFTLSTAKQALAAEDVAVFMPFILVHDKDPYALTLSPWKTLPAWDVYAKFTRENPWPKRAWSREPLAVSPIVMQWLPDNRTCVPHKVSGTYRFKEGQSIKGALRIYNFSDKPVMGRVESGRQTTDVRCQMAEIGQSSIEIPAMGMVAIPLEFSPLAKGYFRDTWSAAFVEVGRVVSNAPQESRSQVSFGLEVEAKLEDFTEDPIALTALPNGVIRFPQIEPYARGEQVGVWTTINGLRAEPAKPEGFGPNTGLSSTPQASGFRSQVSSEARFWIEKENTDPLAPAMAVASVDGLPSIGFLRLQLDKPMTKDRKVLVVLVDDRGQRYTIWENFGADYYGSRSDIWLNLADFHADFWGPMSTDYQFRPERIREVHLRLYLNTPNEPVGVTLTLLKAKSREQGAGSKTK